MLRTSIEHQGADAISRFPTDGEDKTGLNDAFPLLTAATASKAQGAGKVDEKQHIVNEALSTTTPGLRAVYKIDKTSFTKPNESWVPHETV